MKVDVLIPSYRGFNSTAHFAITQMLEFSRKAKSKGARLDIAEPPLRSHGLIHDVRNHALKLVRKTADYVLWCDDDMTPQNDALVRLLEHRLPVVSALTTTRGRLPIAYNVKAYDDRSDMFKQVDEVPEDKVICGPLGVGTGFLLVAKKVLDDAAERYREARDWELDTAEMFFRMGVEPDVVEKERARIAKQRRERMKEGEPARLFDYVTTRSGYQLGEDMSFIRNLILNGVDIAVDTTVQVGHIGDFPYGPWNKDDKKFEEVKL